MSLTATDGTCPACGAAVLWVNGGSGGQLRPFDVEPVARYVFGPDGVHAVDTYAAHFDTCPEGTTRRKVAEIASRSTPPPDPPGMIRNRGGGLVRWPT